LSRKKNSLFRGHAGVTGISMDFIYSEVVNWTW